MQSHFPGIYGIELMQAEIDGRPHVVVKFVYQISPRILCIAITLDSTSGCSIQHIQLLTFQCNRASDRNQCRSSSGASGLSGMTSLTGIF